MKDEVGGLDDHEGDYPPHPLDQRWFAHVDNKNHGPYTGHELKDMIEQRQIIATDFLCPVGSKEWKMAKYDPVIGAFFDDHMRSSSAPPPLPILPQTKRTPVLGIVAIGFGLAALSMPYFAAVFFAPATAVCGLIAMVRRQRVLGGLALALAFVAFVGIAGVSNKITKASADLEKSAKELQEMSRSLPRF
ncbi:GYF domain-containing protein [Bradyrhizobium sp. PMVTL-01]|uniref:DUF4339 domain-containing protein n=1 Tax=Bradyrhizobium sp. PMVTL-01 TaxID=3434999 RepID=UPI003F708EAB